jgi:hypothetical protein
MARATVAWQALLTGDRAFLALAEQLSRQALDALPNRPELQAVRGAVLTRLDSRHGRPLLLQGVRGMEPVPAKAGPIRFLADLDRMTGDPALADEWEKLAAFLAGDRPRGYRSNRGRLLSSQATSSSCVSPSPGKLAELVAIAQRRQLLGPDGLAGRGRTRRQHRGGDPPKTPTPPDPHGRWMACWRMWR